MALMGCQQSAVASCYTWFLKDFYLIHSTFSPSEGSASRVRCQEWVETTLTREQGGIITHRLLTLCQKDAVQERACVCHDFKPISARASSEICEGMGNDDSTLIPLTWCQQHGHMPHVPPARLKSTKHLFAHARDFGQYCLQNHLCKSSIWTHLLEEERPAKITKGGI